GGVDEKQGKRNEDRERGSPPRVTPGRLAKPARRNPYWYHIHPESPTGKSNSAVYLQMADSLKTTGGRRPALRPEDMRALAEEHLGALHERLRQRRVRVNRELQILGRCA